MTCRTPFAHTPADCNCTPGPTEIALTCAEISAAERDVQSDIIDIVRLATVGFVVTLSLLAGIAVVVPQAVENIQATRIAGMPT